MLLVYVGRNESKKPFCSANVCRYENVFDLLVVNDTIFLRSQLSVFEEVFMRIYLSRPDVTKKDIDAVCKVLRSPNLSLGPKLPEFEQAFAKYVGRKHAVAVSSGTSALFLCMLALDIAQGDEVITTPFTFIATSNSVMMVGAKPVFVDIDPVTLNIDATKIESRITGKTRAILPVEIFGSPAGFDKICKIAKKQALSAW